MSQNIDTYIEVTLLPFPSNNEVVHGRFYIQMTNFSKPMKNQQVKDLSFENRKSNRGDEGGCEMSSVYNGQVLFDTAYWSRHHGSYL